MDAFLYKLRHRFGQDGLLLFALRKVLHRKPGRLHYYKNLEGLLSDFQILTSIKGMCPPEEKTGGRPGLWFLEQAS